MSIAPRQPQIGKHCLVYCGDNHCNCEKGPLGHGSILRQRPMTANDRQIGGDHYRSEYQHWDFVADVRMDYFLAVATKHITRWQKKDGIEDLEKTIHYIEKRIEVGAKLLEPEPMYSRGDHYWQFIRANNISLREAHVVYLCTFWLNPGQLLEAVKITQEILDEERVKPQPDDIYTQISAATKVPRDSVKKVCLAMQYTHIPRTDSNKHGVLEADVKLQPNNTPTRSE